MILSHYRYIRSALAACLVALPSVVCAQSSESMTQTGWRLVWSDEFNTDGPLDTTIWNYESGFTRNHEAQWYQPENAYCRDGKLIIEGRKEAKGRKNPWFDGSSDDWRKNREYIGYTSSSVTTRKKMDFRYGRLEVKAKIPVAGGAWPAIWLHGDGMEWPSCGEVDVMEYYRIDGKPHILANACWGNDKRYDAVWNSARIPFSHFTDRDPQWAEKFHIWRMDWDDKSIRLYLDDELLNEIPLTTTVNGSLGQGTNPFRKPLYLLLNLALGGDNGGPVDDSSLPMKYEIDYARVYQKDDKGVVDEGNVMTEEGAWCWFADPRALRHKSYDGKIDNAYIGYIDAHGNIKAMQYDFKAGRQEEVLVRSWFQPDDHDNPTFIVLPDDRVMVFYSRHTDEPCFYYRVTREPGDLTTLGEEKVLATANNTTYPSPFILSDDPEHIYLCWRGINWHPTIARITMPDGNGDVTFDLGPYQIVQSTGARPYAKYDSDGKSRIRLTYTTGHPDNEMPNFLYYNEIDINGLRLLDRKGNVLSSISEGPFKVNAHKDFIEKYPYMVVDSPEVRDWVWQLASDSNGNPVIAMVRISPDKKKHDYYYAKWTGNEWRKTWLASAGGHFHQTPDHERCYSGGMAIDPADVNIVYCSVPVKGINGEVYEIVKYTLGDDGNVISEEAVTKNSRLNNVRPYILPGSEDSPLRLTWMHGNYYDWIVSDWQPEGYASGIHSDFQGFQNQIKKGNPLPAKKVKFDKKKTFDYEFDMIPDNVPADGMILDMGHLSYHLDKESGRPEVRYRKKAYKSTNRLATSDIWKKTRRGTDGKWHEPLPGESFRVRMVYDGTNLTVYVNGLIDQRIRL